MTNTGREPAPDLGSRALSVRSRLRAAYIMAAVVGLLMAAQSATGMLFFSLYRDQAFALEAWRINDPVTLFVATPLVLISLRLALRGSPRALLVLLGAMQYALYNYAFYLFGAALNVHFLIYVALFVGSGLALIAGLAALDAPAVGASFSPRTPVKRLASYMGFWAAALGIAWIGQSLVFAFTGQAPELGEEPFRLIAALDLSLVVTPVAIGAAWLWARRAWGFIIAVILNVKGAIYAMLLSIASLAGGPAAEGGGDGLLGLWVFFTLGSLASVVVLLVNMRPVKQ
jgi:hypothetical protein